MKKASTKKNSDDDLRPEYDLSRLKGGVRGKYYRKATDGTNLVLIEPELSKVFPDSESVNRALRLLARHCHVSYGKETESASTEQAEQTKRLNHEVVENRNNPMESPDTVLTEYDQLRASVGMAPAADDDYYEYVAWVVMFDLDAPEVADECKRLPHEQHELFWMTYATYLYWLAMKGVESKFPANSWRLVAPLLERELSKQPWYQAEVMNRLFDSMLDNPPIRERRGRYADLGASLGPWPDAVMATTMAGHFELFDEC